ncbi:hypothetical protein [Alkalicoccobacillus murimartini]|uniref:DUF3311 domain-containing protein n=1 Tax=Alkalicoccobacillus murimartini TaxID=171685 RepID=A0ABT9YJV0_9BACI|nr:hypothetical protein [Alkalicoccobacillus murimartini]MDQ0208112.1 hypothetical protein [Alkalicoccobacillus murimartini]
MKQRFLICLLLAGVLFSYGVQYLPLGEGGITGWFAFCWVAFAALVLVSNLLAWVRSHPKRQVVRQEGRRPVMLPKKTAEYE